MEKRISLNGTWKFREASDNEWNDGKVPGCVQLDLLAQNRISDPFYCMNELECHKLEEKEWIYRKEFDFDLSEEFDEIKLVFEGIDTIADIYLNGEFLGRAENMYISHEFDVTDIISEKDNVLEVYFHSSTKVMRTLENNSPIRLESSFETARPYIRKAQYAYGWDWGPRLAQVGLWKDVYISVVKDAVIENPFFYTEKLQEDAAFVRVNASVSSFTDQDLIAEVTVSYDGEVCGRKSVHVEYGGIDAYLKIDNPKLWYPNGIGPQPLYNINIKLSIGEDVIDELNFRSGIRVVRLIREKDSEGESFIFEINGIKVFAKGADWIPADNFLSRITKDDYYEFVRLAKDANMNMLRVWGGGIYEDEAFYDACDEMGIMVWQDFMYACAQYPDQFDWFQQMAAEEAEDVLLRLRNHPSIVLWCGNNENNTGFYSWWGNGDPKYLGNYIYKEILPQICAKYDPSRPYWVSSPYGGVDPNSESEGDRHQWDVWSGWADVKAYLADKSRFVSEFGFQSMPDWKTVLSYTKEDDRYILSPVMISHNKQIDGMERLIRYMVSELGFPKDLKSFVYLTQFNQAEAIKKGVEHWRARKFMTAGTLYWQFNDCWPVASWSCIDYYKRKKALYYYSGRFFASVLPYIVEEDGGITIYGISDLQQDAEAHVEVLCYSLDGEKLWERKFNTRLIANDVVKIAHYDEREIAEKYVPYVVPVDASHCTLPVERNWKLLNSVVYVRMTVDEKIYDNYYVFDKFRNLKLTKPNITCYVEGNDITLSTDVPAFGVFVDTENDVDLSDNCLNMIPGEKYTLKCSDNPGDVKIYDLSSLILKI
ncbi:Beta-mannosidase [Thermoanaerobacterium thermosaccharolyticum DSM 571]|uniref:Beta-mannosidase n=1 Tax=Thermoanaerobacterium thermosaccharolyticum (strain ATCC 7956 / DSM 571 / NCIMB 9385 / NCA 3814 / NCTC 13789 / WDCM 00135 / 2032) TaxID=580327 RepID=D9TT63_THETC|nr:sugar-binding domain-containing protein [Thermoanaerobacterium thermosaccharolyticum]ADL68205.1 Beta-mannosidase [Thermoanaerobacterium thermosaccharolyticum DSM 571]